MKQGVLAVEDFRKELKGEKAADREEAAIMLCAIGPKADAAAEDIRIALKDENDGVRVAAARALLAVVGDRQTAGIVMADVLDDSTNDDARANAAMGMGIVGGKHPRVVPALMKALRDSKWLVRWHATRSLGRLGTDAARAEDALIRTQNDPHDDVRAAANKALEDIKKPPKPQKTTGPEFFADEEDGEGEDGETGDEDGDDSEPPKIKVGESFVPLDGDGEE
jgi:HEAT repeat protein